MNKKAQAEGIITIVMGLVGLLIFIVLFAGLFPTFQTSFDGLRDQSNLNCQSTADICGGAGSNTTCYNATVGNTHAISCSIVSIGLPLILIGGILVAFLLIIGGGAVARQY